MRYLTLIVGYLFLSTGGAIAADPPAEKYFTIPVSKLEITEGKLPPPSPWHTIRFGAMGRTGPQQGIWVNPRLDVPGDIEWVIDFSSGPDSWDRLFMAVRTTDAGPITGRIEFVSAEGRESKSSVIRFRVPAGANETRAAAWFRYARDWRQSAEWEAVLRAGAPGAAWFRHRLNEAQSAPPQELAFLWQKDGMGNRRRGMENFRAAANEPRAEHVPQIIARDQRAVDFRGRAWNGDLTELFSGGRAISENLQLDRGLNTRKRPVDGDPVPLANLTGITVREYDWSKKIENLKPQLDPLASRIPADQHVAFFPTIAAAMDVMQELDRSGLALFQLGGVRSVDDRLGERYKAQLGIPAIPIGRLIPASLVSGLAVTGSDLYYDTGTDVAVLLQTEQPAAVGKLLSAAWPKLKATETAVEADFPVEGGRARFLSTEDRRISVYLMELPGVVILTNSMSQLARLVEVHNKKVPALAGSPEYIFFRERYARGDAAETGFVLLPDAAIRRWCGPKWRIAHHRRMMQGAAVAQAQAEHLTAMVGVKKPQEVEQPGLGKVRVSSTGVFAPGVGNRAFLTPIIESEMDTVSAGEADAYRRWRDTYQENWSQFFDPIAVRVTAKPDRMGLDVTVMPLILRTAYRSMADWSIGARLSAKAGDPHPEALAQFTVGFNRESESFKQMTGQFDQFLGLKMSSLSWVGDWFTIYADQDAIWEQVAKKDKFDMTFWAEKDHQIPIAVATHVRDPLKFALFMAALKGVINTTAPNILKWDSGSYRDTTYLKITGKDGLPRLTLYSLPIGDQWLLTLNEKLAHRAIDRHLNRGAEPAGKPAPASTLTLGASAAFTIRPQAVQTLRDMWGRSALEPLQNACWANIAILNEWHSLYPDVDPVTFHERWWGERLLCPLGGKYVWNATDGTMESTLLGHPGRPKVPESTVTPFLQSLRDVQMGVTIEAEGLRARLEVSRGEK